MILHHYAEKKSQTFTQENMATTTTPDVSPNANVELDDTQFNVDHGLLKSLDEATPLHHCTEGAALRSMR